MAIEYVGLNGKKIITANKKPQKKQEIRLYEGIRIESSGKWTAYYYDTKAKKTKVLGTYITQEEAYEQRKTKMLEVYGKKYFYKKRKKD